MGGLGFENSKRLADVEPEVDLREQTLHSPPQCRLGSPF